MTEIIWPYFMLGIALCLFGWTIYWTGINAIGIAVGGGAGVAGGLFGAKALEMPENTAMIMMAIGVVLGAVLGVMLIRTLQTYLFFLLGALLGAPLAWKLLQMPPISEQPWAGQSGAAALAVLIGGLGGGFFVLFARRFIITTVTALVGAVLIAISVPSKNQLAIAGFSFLGAFAIQTGLIRMFVPSHHIERATRRK